MPILRKSNNFSIYFLIAKINLTLIWIHDRIERGRKRHKQEASPQAGWNLIFSKKAKVDKWRRLLSCLVARSMIQNGYRSSISHPHPDMDKGSRERERERDKYKARALSCSIDPWPRQSSRVNLVQLRTSLPPWCTCDNETTIVSQVNTL